jgi:release factor glutamine methyltransferase
MPSHQAPWTVLAILRRTAAYFQEKDVSEPRASAEVLLAHALGITRLDLYLKHDQPLTPEELSRFRDLVKRRADGEPVAYLTGHKEFWSLDFTVSPAVLIPRPETEILVEAVLEAMRESGQGPQPTKNQKPKTKNHFWGLEIGVGSGAVVTVLAKELPDMSWIGLDLSHEALNVARKNARRHEVEERIHFLQGNLFTGLKPVPRFALIVANLPYVSEPEWQTLPRDIRFYEPKEALVGGVDGLALLKPMAREAHRYLKPGGWLALEVGPGQAEIISELLEKVGAYDRLEVVRDFQGINRVVRARRGDLV